MEIKKIIEQVSGLTKNTDELKQLIAEHPDYPIVVLAGEESNGGDYAWMFCTDISFGLVEILTAVPPYDGDYVCCDRDEFYEKMQSWLEDEEETVGLSDEEFFELLKEEIKKFDPYWKNAIAIWATN